MASNYNRKSASSGSRRPSSSRRTGSSSYSNSRKAPSRSQRPASSRGQVPRGSSSSRPSSGYRQVSSVRIGDINQQARNQRAQQTYRRYVIRIVVVAALVACLIGAGFALYNSNLFTVENVTVSGVEHITATEMTETAAVPAGTTLLRIDTAGIKERLLKNAWVQDASVNRVFPNTVDLAITERQIAAVVSVPTDDGKALEEWAIAADGMWLTDIPQQGTEAAKFVSDKVYEDKENVLIISDVPVGVDPVKGTFCTDANIKNALDIVQGLTTELADQVTKVSAAEPASTTLTLSSGVEVAFGDAGTTEEIRTKERVILQLLAEYPDSISYINVRVVDYPTWRAL